MKPPAQSSMPHNGGLGECLFPRCGQPAVFFRRRPAVSTPHVRGEMLSRPGQPAPPPVVRVSMRLFATSNHIKAVQTVERLSDSGPDGTSFRAEGGTGQLLPIGATSKGTSATCSAQDARGPSRDVSPDNGASSGVATRTPRPDVGDDPAVCRGFVAN